MDRFHTIRCYCDYCRREQQKHTIMSSPEFNHSRICTELKPKPLVLCTPRMFKLQHGNREAVSKIDTVATLAAIAILVTPGRMYHGWLMVKCRAASSLQGSSCSSYTVTPLASRDGPFVRVKKGALCSSSLLLYVSPLLNQRHHFNLDLLESASIAHLQLPGYAFFIFH